MFCRKQEWYRIYKENYTLWTWLIMWITFQFENTRRNESTERYSGGSTKLKSITKQLARKGGEVQTRPGTEQGWYSRQQRTQHPLEKQQLCMQGRTSGYYLAFCLIQSFCLWSFDSIIRFFLVKTIDNIFLMIIAEADWSYHLIITISLKWQNKWHPQIFLLFISLFPNCSSLTHSQSIHGKWNEFVRQFVRRPSHKSREKTKSKKIQNWILVCFLAMNPRWYDDGFSQRH